jgi:hypothetical protein
MILRGFRMSNQIVLYKGIECEIVWDYGNGFFEIMVIDEVFLVNESEITKPAIPSSSSSAYRSVGGSAVAELD